VPYGKPGHYHVSKFQSQFSLCLSHTGAN